MALLHFLRLTLLLSLSTLSLNSAADDDGTLTYIISDGEAEVSGFVPFGCVPDLVIPETFEGNSVTSIGYEAFKMSCLTSVTIPNSVTRIGSYAFWSNLLLASVHIGNGVTVIGFNAFGGNQLTSIVIPNSVITIGSRAFTSNKLTRIVLGSSVKNIGRGAFQNNQLTSVSLPHSLLIISLEAFADNKLSRVTIPGDVAIIEEFAFARNQLTNVSFLGDRLINRLESLFPFNEATLLAVTYCTGKDGWPGQSVNSVTPTADCDGDGITDEQELADGTDPFSRFSCKSGCFTFDVDENLEAQPLTDGLLVIRHLFGFSGDSLTSGAVSGGASRNASDAIASYLTDADSQLDIDGDGESKPLTDGLLLIRYLFGFSGDSLVSGAIGSGAERNTAEEVEAYIQERVPVQ